MVSRKLGRLVSIFLDVVLPIPVEDIDGKGLYFNVFRSFPAELDFKRRLSSCEAFVFRVILRAISSSSCILFSSSVGYNSLYSSYYKFYVYQCRFVHDMTFYVKIVESG